MHESLGVYIAIDATVVDPRLHTASKRASIPDIHEIPIIVGAHQTTGALGTIVRAGVAPTSK